MIKPSVINAAGRQWAVRENLLAKLLDNPKRPDRVIRSSLLSKLDGEFLSDVRRVVEGMGHYTGRGNP